MPMPLENYNSHVPLSTSTLNLVANSAEIRHTYVPVSVIRALPISKALIIAFETINTFSCIFILLLSLSLILMPSLNQSIASGG